MHDTTVARPTNRKHLGRTLAAAIGVGGLLAAGIFSTSSATAATVTQNYTVAGTISLGGVPITLPAGSGFSATVDTTTGAITNGHFSIPVINLAPTATVPVPVGVTITDAVAADGTYDSATGAMTLSTHFNISLDIPDLTAACVVSPVNAQPSTANPGGAPFAGTPLSGDLAASGVGVPGLADTAECPIAVAGNGLLGLPSQDGSVNLTLTETDTPVTTTTTIATPTTAKQAAPAPATKAAAKFTG